MPKLNFFEKAIGKVSPDYALNRAVAAETLRMFAAEPAWSTKGGARGKPEAGG